MIRRCAPVFFLLAACASEPIEPEEMELTSNAATVAPPPVFAPNVVNVDRGFSDAVKVNPDSLVIPSSRLGKIRVGSVVAGDRGGKANPYGFLRRVTKIESHGDETTLRTERAELSDWIYAGRIDFAAKTSLFGGSPEGPISPLTLHLQDTPKDGPGGGSGMASMNAKIGPSISLENASLEVGAKFDGYFEVTREKLDFLPDPPTGVRFRSHLVLDPRVTADLRIATKASASIEESWTGPSIAIPIGGPIPITLRFAPSAKCHASADGELGFTVNTRLAAHAELGFQGSATLDRFDVENLSRAPALDASLRASGVDGKATIATGCTLRAEPELLLFDAVGIAGKVGPYIDLRATLCGGGLRIEEEHGLEEAISGHLQIPVLAKGRDFDLRTFKQPISSDGRIAHDLVGDARTCAPK